jgi:hypothetical protein
MVTIDLTDKEAENLMELVMNDTNWPPQYRISIIKSLIKQTDNPKKHIPYYGIEELHNLDDYAEKYRLNISTQYKELAAAINEFERFTDETLIIHVKGFEPKNKEKKE